MKVQKMQQVFLCQQVINICTWGKNLKEKLANYRDLTGGVDEILNIDSSLDLAITNTNKRIEIGIYEM